jgi:hypothetical protein
VPRPIRATVVAGSAAARLATDIGLVPKRSMLRKIDLSARIVHRRIATQTFRNSSARKYERRRFRNTKFHGFGLARVLA